MSDIKRAIREEYLKCAKDPTHFMKKYCYIQHPQAGRIKFGLYPFQEKALNLVKDNPYVFILKSRQLGISTLISGYSLWLMTFHKDKNILALATTQITAKNLVTKVQFMWENLPSWLKVDSVENNKLSLRLSNGSKIQAKSSNSDSARSEAVSLLVIDEAAFIDNIEETWGSAQQTLATGGGCIVLSTPNGIGNWFSDMWEDAVQGQKKGTGKFLPIKLPWFVHPERNQTWRDEQDDLLGEKTAAQECDCDFNNSGDTVFIAEFLEIIEKETIKDPIEYRGATKDLWIWEYPDYSKDYIILVDVARGDGKDNSAAHVIDIETNTQVAEYRGRLSPKELGHFVTSLGTEYNNALLVIENANVGWATIETVLELNYKNLYYSPKGEKLTSESYLRSYDSSSDMVPGFTMSTRTRPLCISKFVECVKDGGTIIRSRRLLGEMKVFIWKNGKPQARTGNNDDLVISYAIGMFLRDTSLRFQQQGLDMAKATLNSIRTNKTTYTGGFINSNTPNPYKSQIGEHNIDLKWLL